MASSRSNNAITRSRLPKNPKNNESGGREADATGQTRQNVGVYLNAIKNTNLAGAQTTPSPGPHFSAYS